MPAPRRPGPPSPPGPKVLTPDDMQQGIRKLQRRIAEVEALKRDQVRRDSERVRAAELNIRETIRDIFGEGSAEFRAHGSHAIWHGPRFSIRARPVSDYELEGQFTEGLSRTVEMLETLIGRLEEKLEDLGFDPAAQARAAFQGRPLHPRIVAAAEKLYRDGSYADAVFAAAKMLVILVKEKSGHPEWDGPDLMRRVFSAKTPTLAFNDLSDQADRDEQEGMMHLYEGAAMALRHLGGHVFPEYPPGRALDYLTVLSTLAERADEATVRTPDP
jgi:uncharacterized protein (TIGR02391 family)